MRSTSCADGSTASAPPQAPASPRQTKCVGDLDVLSPLVHDGKEILCRLKV
jgi:hypothetical protein